MKFKFFAVAMPLALMLTACDKQEEKFAGFTAVSVDKKAAKFYLDTNTVKRDRSGWVSFNMVRDLTDSYVIQNADTNCESRFVAEEGVKYRQDGTSQEKFASETVTLPTDNADVTALVKMACDKAEENRMITGAFDDGKALEILFGNYDANTKTASWENIDPPSSLEDYDKFSGKTGTVKILESKEFIQDGKTKHVLLTSTVSNDSLNEPFHDVLLSSTIFLKNGAAWRIEQEYRYVIVAPWEFEAAHLQIIGKNNYGLLAQNTDYLGHTTASLYDVKRSLPLLKLDELSYGNLIFTGSEDDYPDLIISGVNNDKEQEIYRFLNGKYEFLGNGDLNESLRSIFLDELKKDYKTKIWFSQSFQDGNDKIHVLFTKTNSLTDDGEIADCYRCSLSIGIITYKQQPNNRWEIVSRIRDIDEIGQWGKLPGHKKAEIRQLSSNVKLFTIHTEDLGYGMSGGTTVGADVLFSYSNGHWSNLGFIVTNGDNAGNCDDKDSEEYPWRACYRYTGELSIIPSNKEFPDLLLTKTFAVPHGNPVGKVTYFFNGKKYEEKNDAQVPTVKNEKAAVVQDTSAAKSSIMQMIDYAVDNGGVGHESEIQEAKLKIESSPKPKKGNKKSARKINDEGHALLNKQDIDGAVAKFSEAHRLDTSDVEIVGNLGYAYLKQKNLELAQQKLIDTLTLAPARAAAWSNLGDVFALSGDEHKAVACYANTYRFSKDMAKTHQFMKKMNAAEDVPALKQARDGVMSWAQKVYPELQ